MYSFLDVLGFFSPPSFSWAIIQKWLSNWSTVCIQSVSQWSAVLQSQVPVCRYCSHTLQPHSTPPHCWVSTCSMSWKVAGWSLCSVSSIFGFSLGKRDFCACRTWVPWQLGQLCVSEQQPVPLNYLLQLTWTCISFLFCPVTMVCAAPWVSWRDRWHRRWSHSRWL